MSVNILLVEDSQQDQFLFTMLLEESGIDGTIISAFDGEQAINQLEEHDDIDIIILDVNMPRMNGYEFLTLRDQYLCQQEIPVVVLTSSIHAEDREALTAFESVKEYLVKPLSVEMLQSLSCLQKK